MKSFQRHCWLLCWGLLSQSGHAAPSAEALLQAETIFQLALGRQVISDGLFAYQLEQQSYLPLGELTRVLEFPIMLGPDGQRAEGWFISPLNTFSLDLSAQRIEIREKQIPYTSADLFSSEGEIYVSTEQLSRWFGLEFNVSMPALSITLSSEQPLPMQQRASRDQRYGNFSKGFTIKSELPYTPMPYQLIATPAASINLDSSYAQQNGLARSSYSAQLHGDLLYHSGQLFLSGDDQNGLQNLRLQLGKDDLNSQLLGSLHANRYRLGDISVQSRALIGGNFSGRGFQFSSIPKNQSSEFNRITLEGDLQPQYDVELYRNGGLYEFQRASETGRYKFENVPLFQGMNVLKLIFYGPQGQQYEKIQRLYSDGAAAKAGKLNYRFSLTQPSQTLFNVGDQLSDDQSVAWLASASYGLSRNLSATASLAQYEEEQEQQSFANLGLRGTLGAFLAQSELALDQNGHSAGVFGLQTEWNNIRFDLSHSQYSRDFRNANPNGDPLQQSNSLRVEGSPLRLGDRASTSLFNLNLSQNRQFSGRRSSSVGHNFWLSVGSLSLSNDLRYQENSSSDATLNGSARLSFNADKLLKGFNLRSNVDYSIDPEQQTQNASLGANYRFDQRTQHQPNRQPQLPNRQRSDGLLQLGLQPTL
ncbi:MAG: hypothetical protein Q9O24_06465 [Gammaproteobacteria bacterium]|nr:hypothetical protein [Gammaproteobacteria bacterium]